MSKETGEQQQFLSDDRGNLRPANTLQGQFKLGHWPTAEEMREAGEKQTPVAEALAEMRRRYPLADHRTLYIRVN